MSVTIWQPYDAAVVHERHLLRVAGSHLRTPHTLRGQVLRAYAARLNAEEERDALRRVLAAAEDVVEAAEDGVVADKWLAQCLVGLKRAVRAAGETPEGEVRT